MNSNHTGTDLPEKEEYPKLVRDNIPGLIEKQDSKVVATRILSDDEEFLSYLLAKIREEAEELAEANSDENLIEEIADVYEIIDAIVALKNIPISEITKTQNKKREDRGGFEKRILMLNN